MQHHTLSFPSNPQLTTLRFKISIARPVTALVCPETATFLDLCFDDGDGGNCWRRCPDCRLKISIRPPAEPNAANVPQFDIATLCKKSVWKCEK